MSWLWWIGGPALFFTLFYLYTVLNDYRLTRIPKDALAFSPTRTTPEEVRKTAVNLSASPISIADQLPPKTGRRYIVVGGAGFLGGWVVVKLLERGEDPRRIRVLDIRAPVRHDLTNGVAKDVHFVLCDVSDAAAVDAAFNAPWPEPHASSIPVTVIHTAANIRFYEHSESLLYRSANVIVQGTQNIINASRAIGASALIYTSSGSVSVRSQRFLLWPWETEPRHFVQAIDDDDALIPKRHEDFFSNYAVSKAEAEKRVRAADKSVSGNGVMRTGCIRPSNGIFGPGGDMLCGAYLVRKVNPTWTNSIVQNFIYVENAAIAHLLYEQRLLELAGGSKNPDIGGQAFCVCDPGPPPTYGDAYETLSTLTDGETVFPFMSPTLMILIAHLIEWYYLTYLHLTRAGYSLLLKLLPPLNGDIVNLQPSLFNLVDTHLVFDDSRARLPPEKGGLGYKGAWTTHEGLHKTVEEHKLGLMHSGSGQRSDVAGVSLGFWSVKAKKGKAVAAEVINGEKIGFEVLAAN